MQAKQSQITFKDFKIHNKDGSIKPDIIKAFIITRTLTPFDILDDEINENDHIMKLIVDPAIQERFRTDSNVNCIISCQIRKSGHYAIARIKNALQDQSTLKESQS